MLQINGFSRNVNSVYVEFFSTHIGIKEIERKFDKHSAER